MIPTWRMKLREARLAFRSGRYDEASNLLERSDVREFLPAKQLAQEVAARIVSRAEDRLAQGDTHAGWHDLATAGRLGGQDGAVDRVKQRYIEHAVAEIQRLLASGEPRAAVERLKRLARRGFSGEFVREYKQIADSMLAAEHATATGRLTEAVAALDRAQALAGSRVGDDKGIMKLATYLRNLRERIAEKGGELCRLTSELHDALAKEDWGTTLSTAESILAISPKHGTAVQARRRAWKAVGMNSTRCGRFERAHPNVSLAYGNGKPVDRQLRRSTRPSIRSFEDDTVNGPDETTRFLLWVDAVGGFLVCMDDYLVLGQPAPGQPLAVPILGDISRRHAVIRRDGGAYILEPLHETYVDGRKLTGATVLSDGQLIQLGERVELRFAKPHALSSTARLTIESGHKTQPSADAIILMADSCVLGPNSHCHVRARDWQADVILFRQEDGLMCRSPGELTVNDQPTAGPVRIVSGECVGGEDFSFSVEQA